MSPVFFVLLGTLYSNAGYVGYLLIESDIDIQTFHMNIDADAILIPRNLYFPIQNFPNIFPSTSSVLISPTMEPK